MVNDQPKEMGLVQAIQHFRRSSDRRGPPGTAYLLMKARERGHILEGYQVALDRVDDVIRIIRGSAEPGRRKDQPGRLFLRQDGERLRRQDPSQLNRPA